MRQRETNCASRVCYDYTPEQVEQIIAALEVEVRRLQSAFTGENRFTLRP